MRNRERMRSGDDFLLEMFSDLRIRKLRKWMALILLLKSALQRLQGERVNLNPKFFSFILQILAIFMFNWQSWFWLFRLRFTSLEVDPWTLSWKYVLNQ